VAELSLLPETPSSRTLKYSSVVPALLVVKLVTTTRTGEMCRQKESAARKAAEYWLWLEAKSAKAMGSAIASPVSNRPQEPYRGSTAREACASGTAKESRTSSDASPLVAAVLALPLLCSSVPKLASVARRAALWFKAATASASALSG